MKLLQLLRGAVVFLAAVLTLSTARQFEHVLDNDEVTLSSRGVLRDIVVLSEENGIKVSPLFRNPSIFGWINMSTRHAVVVTCMYIYVHNTYMYMYMHG